VAGVQVEVPEDVAGEATPRRSRSSLRMLHLRFVEHGLSLGHHSTSSTSGSRCPVSTIMTAIAYPARSGGKGWRFLSSSISPFTREGNSERRLGRGARCQSTLAGMPGRPIRPPAHLSSSPHPSLLSRPWTAKSVHFALSCSQFIAFSLFLRLSFSDRAKFPVSANLPPIHSRSQNLCIIDSEKTADAYESAPTPPANQPYSHPWASMVPVRTPQIPFLVPGEGQRRRSPLPPRYESKKKLPAVMRLTAGRFYGILRRVAGSGGDHVTRIHYHYRARPGKWLVGRVSGRVTGCYSQAATLAVLESNMRKPSRSTSKPWISRRRKAPFRPLWSAAPRGSGVSRSSCSPIGTWPRWSRQWFRWVRCQGSTIRSAQPMAGLSSFLITAGSNRAPSVTQEPS